MAREALRRKTNKNDAYPERMIRNLEVLRAAAKLSQEELASYVGISRARYTHIISGCAKLSWKNYLSFVFFFEHNERTKNLLHQLELYPTDYVHQINQPTRKELRQ